MISTIKDAGDYKVEVNNDDKRNYECKAYKVTGISNE
jgi:hypothetical protein